jgi:hypothetical protein
VDSAGSGEGTLGAVVNAVMKLQVLAPRNWLLLGRCAVQGNVVTSAM